MKYETLFEKLDEEFVETPEKNMPADDIIYSHADAIKSFLERETLPKDQAIPKATVREAVLKAILLEEEKQRNAEKAGDKNQFRESFGAVEGLYNLLQALGLEKYE